MIPEKIFNGISIFPYTQDGKFGIADILNKQQEMLTSFKNSPIVSEIIKKYNVYELHLNNLVSRIFSSGTLTITMYEYKIDDNYSSITIFGLPTERIKIPVHRLKVSDFVIQYKMSSYDTISLTIEIYDLAKKIEEFLLEKQNEILKYIKRKCKKE